MSEEEEAVEKACEEERYLELHTDVQEAAMYEEEEWKRYYLSLQDGYQAVGFSYDQQEGTNYEELQLDCNTEGEEKIEPFVVPEELCVPGGTPVPDCKKQNERIMKTANFIAQHGIQMEIMLKTKQAGNSQFDFLHFENELNPYYKHVVSMIKSNKYKPPSEEEPEAHDESQDYLHPSLSATSLPPPPPPPSKPIELPKVSIHDTPYGALIKSIKKNSEPIPAPILPPEANSLPAPPIPPLPLIPTPTHSSGATPASSSYSQHPNNPPPPGTEPVSLPMVSSLNGKAFVEQLYSQPPPPGTEPADYPDSSSPRPRKRKERRRKSSDSESSSSSSSSSSDSEDDHSRNSRKSSRSSNKPQRVEGPNPIAPPPPDMQPIIDRMAMYVAKNGAEFEMVVMGRKDPRFQFLNQYHAFYPYYRLMKESYEKDLNKTAASQDPDGKGDKCDESSQRGVSFSIRGRGKDQEGSASGNNKTKTLFQYDSSEGEDGRHCPTDPPSEAASSVASPSARLSPDDDKEIAEKLKDKLASAMKERLSQSHKEKQLQAERKKKAAAFLSLIKAKPEPTVASQSPAPNPQPEDAALLYVGEGTASPVIFEYDNRSIPQRLESRDRPNKEKKKKRRRRSPTPPTAYNLDRRSPVRLSPNRWSVRPSAWSGRDRSPQWSRRARDNSKRSRSRSPHRKEEKRKKHKRSKSRSPSRKSSSKDKSSRSSGHKSSKDRDKERKKEKKNRRHSKEPPSSSSLSSSNTSAKAAASSTTTNGRAAEKGGVLRPVVVAFPPPSTNSSDMEVLEGPPPLPPVAPSLPFSASEGSLLEGSVTDLSSIPMPGSSSKTTVISESTESSSRPTSLCNSPSLQDTRSNTPSRASETTSSSDLMSKVRAMLKKSRELALKEDSLQFDVS